MTTQSYSQSSTYNSSSPFWVADSGATHHVTPNPSNLSIYSDYEGSDSIQVASGEGLSILHKENSSLHTPFTIFSLTSCSLYDT